MTVTCINNNGWYQWRGNYYGFVEPRPTEVNGPIFGVSYSVAATRIDSHGDLLYELTGNPLHAWEAACFAVATPIVTITLNRANIC